MEAVMEQEQQERLRRFVDEWRNQAWNFGDGGHIEDHVQVSMELTEPAPVLDLINSDNVPLSKLLYVMSFDCVGLKKLRFQAYSEIYPRLLVFGYGKALSEGEVQKKFANSYHFFQKLKSYLSQLRQLMSNLLQQLQALYTIGAKIKQLSSFSNVHFYTAVMALAEGFSIVMTVDEIVARNGGISHAFSHFLRMLHSVRSEPLKFDMESEQVERLHQIVSEMDELLLGGIFQRWLQEDFLVHSVKEDIKANSLFLEELCYCIRHHTTRIMSRMDSTSEHPDDREHLVGLVGQFVLCSWMSAEAPEKRTFKMILNVVTRLPLLHTFSNVRLVGLEFLTAHLSPWARSLTLFKDYRKDLDIVYRSYLFLLDEALTRDLPTIYHAVLNWLVSLNSGISSMVKMLSTESILNIHLKQLTLGVFLASRLSCFVKSIIDLHVLLEVPISKDKIRHLCYCVELLKAMEGMYYKKTAELAHSTGHIIQFLRSQIKSHLLLIKSQLDSEIKSRSKTTGLNLFTRSLTSTASAKDFDSKLNDGVAAVNVAIDMLQNAASIQKRTIFHLALEAISVTQTKFQGDSMRECRDLASLVDMSAEIDILVGRATDCSFLYWNREMMSACFSTIYAQVDEARHLQYLITAFKDGVKLLQAGCSDKSAVETYDKDIENSLTTEVVAPLCRDIETDLRLHVHSAHLKGAVSVNPTKTGVRDLSWFLHLNPLRLTSKYLCIKSRVENYLNAAFYDHAAVALHNWKTYNEMKILGEQKYGLVLQDIHLPGQTLEQGVDVLEIMRNIHTFVSTYTYDLNTQVFIEKISNAHNRKYLNTVSIKHISNSIRTHGLGIMSTTVNFAYQFLSQKFVVFSQFLFDDHIKSRLIKEQHYFKEKKRYSFARAEKLSKDIRKLGVREDGVSFLDQFRHLITEMGNALGFVRMVRMGGLHYCSTASGYTPHASSMQGELQMQSDAAKILVKALESQAMSFEQTDYFAILKNVFTEELQSIENLHLRDFYLIIPALSLNAVDAMIQAKDKLHKRGRDAANAMVSDDGFALGLAYILKVVGQEKSLDALHWFECVKEHLLRERMTIEESMDMDNIGNGMNGLQAWSQKLASLSKEEAHNMQLVVKRLTNYLNEMELIECALTGSRVLFS